MRLRSFRVFLKGHDPVCPIVHVVRLNYGQDSLLAFAVVASGVNAMVAAMRSGWVTAVSSAGKILPKTVSQLMAS